MGNNKTKNIILAVLVVGIVGMTVAFAALTQQLNITDNVATVSSNWRVRFAPTVTTSVGTTIAGTTTGATYTSNTPIVTNDQQTITGLQATFTKPGDYVEVAFTVRNEGNIAAKGQGVTLSLGNLTCAPGSGSSVSQEAANTFCTKLVKWVKHSDRVTDWTSADTLAAYSGSGNDYPHIDGILRIEYPSTLTNSDINAINGGSVVVTLGDTTLYFEQDDNVTASSNSGGNETPVTTYSYYGYGTISEDSIISSPTSYDLDYEEYQEASNNNECPSGYAYDEGYDEYYPAGCYAITYRYCDNGDYNDETGMCHSCDNGDYNYETGKCEYVGYGDFALLSNDWTSYLRNDGTTPETCGVFGSGTAGTVCLTSSYYNNDYSSAGNYESDFEDVTESTSDITTTSGLTATGLKGYSLTKAQEMLSKGASSCYVGDYGVECYRPSGLDGQCSIEKDGYVYCNDSGTNCHVDDDDGSYYCD